MSAANDVQPLSEVAKQILELAKEEPVDPARVARVRKQLAIAIAKRERRS